MPPWGDRNLQVLTSGEVPPNPSELLGSRSMANLLEQLASRYDMVLIDTPPLLPVTDAAILAKITGGALVVAGADILHLQQLADGLGSLDEVSACVLGIVLNRLAHKQTGNYSYYDYSSQGTGNQSKGKQEAAATSGRTPQRFSRPSKRRSASQSDPGQAPAIDPRAVRVSSTDDQETLALSSTEVNSDQ